MASVLAEGGILYAICLVFLVLRFVGGCQQDEGRCRLKIADVAVLITMVTVSNC